MFKLLIVDDEQLERDALRFIISRSVDSISEIEEAVNGREAITKAQTGKPHIIILDINMPGINGIEAARKIREEDKSVIIIFLTAFHQFDYAHEAIKVGVVDYIVKPSSEKRILEVMDKVCTRLMERLAEHQKQQALESRLDKVTDYLSSEFTYNLATRTLEEEKYKNYLTLLDLDLHRGRGVILKLKHNSYPINSDEEFQKQVLKKRSLRLFKTQMERFDLHCLCNLDLNTILILIYSDRYNGLMESDDQLAKVIQSVSESIMNDLKIELIAGFGSLFDSPQLANQSFEEAKRSLKEISHAIDLPSWEEDFPIDLEMDLEQALMGTDKTKLEALFLKLEEWSQSHPSSFETKKKILLDLTAILRHSASMQFPSGECRIETSGISRSQSLLELTTAFRDSLLALVEKMVFLYSKENIPVIKKACQYIKENYNREITLEDTASFCHLSTFYFSKIFKEHKNKNFINYLTEIRLEEAKRLLKETDLTMKEISGRVGYRDPNYFARVFKRVLNCSPREFRNNKMLQ